ncbi:MAG: penicillin-binding transpeptidase domain-containing protein, partial [Candidatus Dormibacteria bacterium]
ASFGQGVQTTPIELLAAINAVGNGGVWVQPHAVDAVVDPATGAATPVVAPEHRVIDAATAATLAQMMVGVVEDKIGSGFLARIPAFKGQIAGKTGTASAPTNGKYSGEVITSFAGFMPAKNPRFTMLVVLRHPHENRVQREGAFLAAPVWKDIAQIAIDAWRITPEP